MSGMKWNKCPRCKTRLRKESLYPAPSRYFMIHYYCKECEDYYHYDSGNDYFYKKYSAAKLRRQQQKTRDNLSGVTHAPLGGAAYCLVSYSERKPEIIPDREFLEYLEKIKRESKKD